MIVLPGPPTTEGDTATPATPAPLALADRSNQRRRKEAKAPAPSVAQRNGLRFGIEAALPTDAAAAKLKQGKPKREKPQRFKSDPKLIAAAREFRDRYLEEVNAEGGDRLLAWNGKYDVSRQLAVGGTASTAAMIIEQVPGPRLLDAA